ncbi:predicted protein [Chaetoceros tenuissimus]|uniref:Uncharacterized protein n=1 Tax=Chaetoceros tenuissimus TaxID=426638 RepID=A0AAD3CYX0_9STRA|nr:predicted protein [Chaetoceros tenuissimus]
MIYSRKSILFITALASKFAGSQTFAFSPAFSTSLRKANFASFSQHENRLPSRLLSRSRNFSTTLADSHSSSILSNSLLLVNSMLELR